MDESVELNRILSERLLKPLFQPIVACREQKIYGYEALIRGPSDSMLHAPLNLFDAAMRCERLVELDLACRQAAIAAFGRLGLPGRLFLNVTPSTVVQSDFRAGETARFLDSCGISPQRIVIELTEHIPIPDYAIMRRAVDHYRSMGFSIAIDDLGAGYSGLRHWAELRPDYVKIDRHFVQGADRDDNKRAFVRSIIEMARSLGCRVVAEGIETQEEYRGLWSMGLEFGQGYYFSRPSPNPPLTVHTLLPISKPEWGPQQRFGETVRNLVRLVPGVAPDTPVEQAAERFRADRHLRSLVVLENGRPQGLLRRAQMLDMLSGYFGHALYSKRPVSVLASSDMLIARDDLPLEALSQRVTESSELAGDEIFVIVDAEGRYVGQGTLIDLLRRITELQVRNARHANPLTGLPGNVPINEKIDALLLSGEPFVAAYCDLDRFKAFNDCYGYARGDDLIIALSHVLREVCRHENEFLGHIGGDDFMLLLQGDDWESRLQHALARFDALAPWHYDEPDREAGGLQARDRQGQYRFHSLVSLSIGVLPVQPGRFSNPHEVANVLSELKAQAKACKHSSLFAERRAAASASADCA